MQHCIFLIVSLHLFIAVLHLSIAFLYFMNALLHLTIAILHSRNAMLNSSIALLHFMIGEHFVMGVTHNHHISFPLSSDENRFIPCMAKLGDLISREIYNPASPISICFHPLPISALQYPFPGYLQPLNSSNLLCAF